MKISSVIKFEPLTNIAKQILDDETNMALSTYTKEIVTRNDDSTETEITTTLHANDVISTINENIIENASGKYRERVQILADRSTRKLNEHYNKDGICVERTFRTKNEMYTTLDKTNLLIDHPNKNLEIVTTFVDGRKTLIESTYTRDNGDIVTTHESIDSSGDKIIETTTKTNGTLPNGESVVKMVTHTTAKTTSVIQYKYIENTYSGSTTTVLYNNGNTDTIEYSEANSDTFCTVTRSIGEREDERISTITCYKLNDGYITISRTTHKLGDYSQTSYRYSYDILADDEGNIIYVPENESKMEFIDKHAKIRIYECFGRLHLAVNNVCDGEYMCSFDKFTDIDAPNNTDDFVKAVNDIINNTELGAHDCYNFTNKTVSTMNNKTTTHTIVYKRKPTSYKC